MARPLGPVARAVVDRLSAVDEAMTMREIAQAEQISLRVLRWTLNRLVASGRVSVVGQLTLPPARRPLALYSVPISRAGRCRLVHCNLFSWRDG